MSSAVKNYVFDDLFQINDSNPDGPKFDRVSRLFCSSENVQLILDINTQLYPMAIGEKFRLALAFTLRNDGLADEGEYDPSVGQFIRVYLHSLFQNQSSAMKIFQYIMHGRIYRVEGEDAGAEASKTNIYISFGGLLMRLQGEASALSELEVDKTIYLLIKKLAV
jgi:DNA-directed RNA polymerase I, II, and III subunit RPABC3